MRFATPIILATIAILATAQAAPAGGEGKGAPAISNKSVDLDPDLDANVDNDGVQLPGNIGVPPEDDDFDIEDCLDDPDQEECPDIEDFDVDECLEEFSRNECLHKLKEFMKHHREA